MTRRSLLGSTALAVAGLGVVGLAPIRAFAATPEADFFAVSSLLTDKKDLSEVTSKRIFDALNGDDPGFAARLARLAALVPGQSTGAALKAAAVADGLEADVTAIVTAWYTGTVTTRKGPVVIAYKDALMYRPVADGLTVPTYCSNGPVWWSGLPPEIARMPVNLPKVL